MTTTSFLMFLLPLLILGAALYARLRNIVPVKNPRHVEMIRVATMVLLIAAAFIAGKASG